MKILLVCGIYRPDIGGPATYIPTLAERLLNEMHQVEVVTLKNESSIIESEPWLVNRISRNQLLILRFIRTCVMLLKRSKEVDVVFANGLFEETAITLLIRKKRSVAKVVGDDVWHRANNRGTTHLSMVEFNNSKLGINHKLQRSFLTWSLNQFDEITCPSKQLEQIIINWGVRSPITVIPNGAPNVECKNKTKVFDLVSVSRLIKLKNIDRVIRVASECNASLVIVGNGPEENELKIYARSLNANVTFTGSLNNSEVMGVLCQSKIFMLISDHEGMSFALLEAMAVGLAPIVSNVTGNTAVVSNTITGLVVNATNHEEIVEAVKNLLNAPLILKKISESAMIKVKNEYSQESQIKKMVRLILHRDIK
jgi:glycosyltransferase involved in cell wall biosynthesis